MIAISDTLGQRNNGVLVSMVHGKALAYALYNLQERGRLMIGHGEPVYEGMIVGINSRQNDLVVNPTKAKQLNNIRAAGNDENIVLTPAIRYSLEQALEFVDDDELLLFSCSRAAAAVAAAVSSTVSVLGSASTSSCIGALGAMGPTSSLAWATLGTRSMSLSGS